MHYKLIKLLQVVYVTASLLLISVCVSASAQTPTDSAQRVHAGSVLPIVFKGKTHALIVGISHYNFLPSLKFAHRDAQAFAQFLHSPYYSGGIVNDTLLLDANAKFVDIRALLKDMYYRVKEGDRVILFFAGHGDREVETSGSYLLTYDTFLNNYAGTGISLDWLKRLIANLVEKKVTVWLIADACRSGDFKMAGDHIKGRYRVWESWQPFGGEIDILSCQTEELSYESQKWENGHGVFSYYLMKGMKGAADSLGDNDFQVKAFELDAYLKLKVTSGALPAKQTPSVSTADQQTVVANIPPPVVDIGNNASDQNKRSLMSIPIQQMAPSFSDPTRQSEKPNGNKTLAPVVQPKKKDIERKRQHDNKSKKLVNKADTLLQNKVADEAYYKAMAEVQPILLAYLDNGPTAKSAEFYARASYLLMGAVQQMSPIDPDYTPTRALHHFFSGLYQNTIMNLQSALVELNTALALDSTKAFIFYERGRTYTMLVENYRANQDFRKAAALSPTWSLLNADQKTLIKLTEPQLVANLVSKKQGQRKALVIGNSNYANIPALKTPANDAVDMAHTLQGVGFSISTYVNVDYKRMNFAIDDFINKLIESDTVVFYYSGHGISYQGDNYLLPVDAAVNREDRMAENSFALEKLTNALKSKQIKTSILFLDACRTPLTQEKEFMAMSAFGGSRSRFMLGLTAQDELLSGSLAVYANETGNLLRSNNKIDRNGLFTSELIKNLNQTNLSVRQIINKTTLGVKAQTNGSQTPASYDRLEKDFTLPRP